VITTSAGPGRTVEDRPPARGHRHRGGRATDRRSGAGRPAYVAAGSLVALAWIGSTIVIAAGPARAYSLVGGRVSTPVLVLLAGIALATAGASTMLLAPHRRIGGALLLAGCCWFLPLWVTWQSAPPAAITLAHALSPGLLALLVQSMTDLSRRGRRAPVRALLLVSWSNAVLLSGVRILLEDPYQDPGCWVTCSHNPFALAQAPLTSSFPSHPSVADTIETIASWVAASTLIAAAALLARRAWPPSLSRLDVSVAALGSLLIAGCALGLASVSAAYLDPSRPAVVQFWTVGSIGALLFSGAHFLALAGSWVRVRRLADLVVSAEASAGGLERVLRDALGDPGLTIAFSLPESQRLVTSNGDPVPAPEVGTSTDVRVGNRRVATIMHTAAIADLVAGIGPSLRVRMENELLRTESAVQLDALRESLSRIVAAGDAHRRQLERNLHDGAQQHLLAVGGVLRSAAVAARDRGDTEAAAALASAVDETRAALGDLRELARGIFPAELANDGLAVALVNLSIEAPIPVEVKVDGTGRSNSQTEAAAYLSAQELIAAIHRGGGTHLVLQTMISDRAVRLRCDHDVDRAIPLPAHVLDRVGALGGEVTAEAGWIQVWVPGPRPAVTAITAG